MRYVGSCLLLLLAMTVRGAPTGAAVQTRADLQKQAERAWSRLQAADQPSRLRFAPLPGWLNGYAVKLEGVRAALEKAGLAQGVSLELLAGGRLAVPLGNYLPRSTPPNQLGPQPEPPDLPAGSNRPQDPTSWVTLNPQPEPPARFLIPDTLNVVTASPLVPGRAELLFRDCQGVVKARVRLELTRDR